MLQNYYLIKRSFAFLLCKYRVKRKHGANRYKKCTNFIEKSNLSELSFNPYSPQFHQLNQEG